MAGQRGGASATQLPYSKLSHSRQSKRRNTVHSTSPEPSPTALWPPTISAYSPLQQSFLPLYSPLWQFAQINNLSQTGLLQAASLSPSAAPARRLYTAASPRSTSPRGLDQLSPKSSGRAAPREEESGNGVEAVGSQGDGKRGHPTMRRRKNSAASSMNNSLSVSHGPLVRPPIDHRKSSLSIQSSSVPSTPQAHARMLSYGSRSPSPDNATRHSPRSAHSEPNSVPPSFRKPPDGCRFEAGLTFKRRMPYALGGDKLEKAKDTPKARLLPSDESKLSRDMEALFEQLLPDEESGRRRLGLVNKVEKLLTEEFPESAARVRVFGSSGNLLCTSDSDVDICITTPMKELEKVCILAETFAKHGMERVVCVPNAKVPIVKIWDPEFELACDMNVNNTMALENTRMIKVYVEIDERVRPLAMIIKHWTKRRKINDAALGGTLSSYTWICMIINFLQMRKPPILPSLHQRPHQKRPAVGGIESSFADDIDSLRQFGLDNKESLGSLLFHFFRFYAHEMDFEKQVVSVRQGKLISKQEKGWDLMQNNRLCVEEPFNTTRNLGNTADDSSVRGLHLELRRAFMLLSRTDTKGGPDGKGAPKRSNLEICCEEYEYPPQEERFWEKPPPVALPTLSRRSSQSGKSGRGGSGNPRMGRHINTHGNRTANANRRASSGASFSTPPVSFLQHPQLGVSAQDYYIQTQQAQAQLQEQLYHSYLGLQAQAAELRFKQAQAQAQAHAIAQAQMSDLSLPASKRSSALYPNRAAAFENTPLTAPLRQEVFYYPFQTHMNPQYHPQGTHTNPPSPSITPATPEFRRGSHRSQFAEGTSAGSHRSQSQPARPIPSPLVIPPSHGSSQGYQIMSALQPMRQNPFYPTNGLPHSLSSGGLYMSQALPPQETSYDDSTPREYLGYYLGGSPPAQQLHDDKIYHVPVFGDLPVRQRNQSPERYHQPVQQQMPQAGRSRSLSGRSRTTSIGSHSFPSPFSKAQTESMSGSYRTDGDRGPLIVDGSTSTSRGDISAPQWSPIESAVFLEDQTSDPWGTVHESQQQDVFGGELFLRRPEPATEYAAGEPVNSSSRAHSVSDSANGKSSLCARRRQASLSPIVHGDSTSSYNENYELLHGNEKTHGHPAISSSANIRTPERIDQRQQRQPTINDGPTAQHPGVEAINGHTAFLSPVYEMSSPPVSRDSGEPVALQTNVSKVINKREKTKEVQPPPTPASPSIKHTQHNETLTLRPNGTVPASPVSPSNFPSGRVPTANGWQQTPGSKQNKKKAAKAAAAAKRNSAPPLIGGSGSNNIRSPRFTDGDGERKGG